MKITRLFAIIAAAGVFAACQNEEHIAPVAKTFEVSATASVPATKTAISADGEGYVPTWKAGDKIAIVEKALATNVYASNALQADALQATFTATMNQVSADAYAYCAVYPYEAFKTTTDLANLVCTVPAEQTPATMTSFDGNADILVSEVINLTAQPTAEALAFNMRRLTATGMVSFRGLDMMPDETISSWSITASASLAGTVNVNPASEELVVSNVNTTGTINVTLPLAQTGDFTSCFTCLPCVLEAGSEYTVTVYTNCRTISKKATIVSPLSFEDGKVQNLNVNMTVAAPATSAEKFSDAYDYVITSTVDGVTYILPNTAIAKNPALVNIASASLTITESGALLGEVPAQYRWKASSEVKEEAVVATFSYTNANGDEYHLVHCDQAQGLTIAKPNADGSYTGGYTKPYSREFKVVSSSYGYKLQLTARQVAADPANSRWGCASGNNGTIIRFHRITPATITEETLLKPVDTQLVKESKDVKAGKYIVVGAHGTEYSLLSGAAIAKNPGYVSAEEAGVILIDDVLYSDVSKVDQNYVWNIAPAQTDGYWTVCNQSTSNYLFGYNTAQGVGVATTHASWSNEWTFTDKDGLQAMVNGSARYLCAYFVNADTGIQWRMATGCAGYRLLLIPINE